MAKVKKEIVEAALVKLVDNITATMPSTTYKFILGGAAGLLSVSRLDKIKGMLSVFQDENGLVDTDKLKAVYKSAFKAAGGKFQVELFSKPQSLLQLFVKPLTLTISEADIDSLVKEVDQNAAVNEVALSAS